MGPFSFELLGGAGERDFGGTKLVSWYDVVDMVDKGGGSRGRGREGGLKRIIVQGHGLMEIGKMGRW